MSQDSKLGVDRNAVQLFVDHTASKRVSSTKPSSCNLRGSNLRPKHMLHRVSKLFNTNQRPPTTHTRQQP